MALKIALVEDDSSIRAMLEYYFKSLGHEIAAFERIFLQPLPRRI